MAEQDEHKPKREGRGGGGGVNPLEKLEESVSFTLHHREKSSAKGLGKIPCAPHLPPPPCLHLALLPLLAKHTNKAAFPHILLKLRESHRRPQTATNPPGYLFYFIFFQTLDFIVISIVINLCFVPRGNLPLDRRQGATCSSLSHEVEKVENMWII